MSVGPGKIRVFRADNKGAKKAESPTRRKSVSAKPKKAPKLEPRLLGMDGKTPEKRVAANGRTVSPSNPTGPRKPISAEQGKSAPPLDKRAEPRVAIRVKHRLVLNDKQRARLEALFSAPNALASLLRAYPQRLVTPSDASVFLLSNRKELDTYINPDARGRAVDVLTELLLQWSGSPSDSIGIDFDEVSLTPDQKVYLPLEGYRGVEVAEPMQLLGQRKGRLFRAPFTLFEEGKHFLVAFLGAKAGHQTASAARQAKGPRQQTSRNPAQTGAALALHQWHEAPARGARATGAVFKVQRRIQWWAQDHELGEPVRLGCQWRVALIEQAQLMSSQL